MAKKRFDAALKHLLEKYPQDLSRFLVSHLGLSASGPVTLLEADVATVSAAADKVFRIGGRRPWLLHVEFQSSPKHHLDRQLLLYNVLLNARHRLPVRSVVLLLRRGADRPGLTGVLRQEWPAGHPYLEFCYSVLRPWQLPLEPFLTGGLGLLPLAALTNFPEERLEGVLHRIEARIASEAPPSEADDLLAATYVLLGLQYSPELVEHMIGRARAMRESATYRAILREGAREEAQDILLDLGADRFGGPEESTRVAVRSITSLPYLRELLRHLPEASSWEELLATPRPQRGQRRRNGA